MRVALVIVSLIVLALCIFILPSAIASDTTGGYYPIIFGMYITAIPFFIALYKAWKLLGHIEANSAFSNTSIRALRYIKCCAFTISALYAGGMPYIYFVADQDDAPGVLAISLVITFASLVISFFAAVLQKLLQNALEIKHENDLTV